MVFQGSREALIAMSEDWCSYNRAMVLLNTSFKKKINQPSHFVFSHCF